MITSTRFEQYARDKKAYSLQLWTDKELTTFFDCFPEGVTGRYLKKTLKDWDYWDFHPKSVNSLCAIVSKKFVDVLNELGVSREEFFLKEIRVGKANDVLYMLFVPLWGLDVIIYPQSTFEIGQLKIDRKKVDINSKDEHLKLVANHYYPHPIKAVISEIVRDKDIFQFQSNVYPCFSERLVNALRLKGVTGFEVVERMEVFAL